MRWIVTFSILTFLTAVAAAAFWFWALRPLGFGSYFSDYGTSEANMIRQYWPHRLVQPEWVGGKSATFIHWSFAEAVARSSVITVVWLAAIGGLVHRRIRQQKMLRNARQ